MSELDADFDSLVKQINIKLNEAAAALKEANRLREQAGLQSLIYTAWMRETENRDARNAVDEEMEEANRDYSDDEYEDRVEAIIEEERAVYENFDVAALEREMDNAGWSTSSSYC